MGRPARTLDQQLEAGTQFDPNGGCWLYEKLNPNGYGQLSAGDRHVAAHRRAYERAKGPIPDGLVVDHMCRVRACVNPAHLRAVTQAVNVIENSVSASALNKKKSCCPKGHPYATQKGARADLVVRICRECGRAKDKRRYFRIKADPVARAAALAKNRIKCRAYHARRVAMASAEKANA